MVLEKRSMLICGASNMSKGSIMMMSSSPSAIEAWGAMYALLPYCDALAHEMRNAFLVFVPVSSVMMYVSGLYLSPSRSTFSTYVIGPRFPASANFMLTKASKPMPQVQKNGMPLITP